MPSVTKVLVIDDSAFIRQMMSRILNSDPDIKVVATATDPIDAEDKIRQLKPDVLTLDIEMPRMDGITFLKKLMHSNPMPVVMVSAYTKAGASVSLEALELGAIDVVEKPKLDALEQLQSYSDRLIEKVKMAANARVRSKVHQVTRPEKKLTFNEPVKKVSNEIRSTTQFIKTKASSKIIAIGSSTGGTEAIKDVLVKMPANAPAIVISQHIPASFSASFAQRMNTHCAMKVHHASDGQQILPGNVYIAPGSHHLLVERNGSNYVCKLDNGELVNRHRPSVDVMFGSVLKSAGTNAVAVLLTGMGADGAKVMKDMHDQGIKTIAQDEDTCVVWGMPGSAVKLGAVDYVLPLDKIAEKILSIL